MSKSDEFSQTLVNSLLLHHFSKKKKKKKNTATRQSYRTNPVWSSVYAFVPDFLQRVYRTSATVAHCTRTSEISTTVLVTRQIGKKSSEETVPAFCWWLVPGSVDNERHAQLVDWSMDISIDRWHWYLFLASNLATRQLSYSFMLYQLYLIVILRFAEECGESVLSQCIHRQ